MPSSQAPPGSEGSGSRVYSTTMTRAWVWDKDSALSFNSRDQASRPSRTLISAMRLSAEPAANSLSAAAANRGFAIGVPSNAPSGMRPVPAMLASR